MALVVQEETFICFLSVDAGFKAAVDFDDFHANEWQSIVGCYFHRKLKFWHVLKNHAGYDRIQVAAFFLAKVMIKHNWSFLENKINRAHVLIVQRANATAQE